MISCMRLFLFSFASHSVQILIMGRSIGSGPATELATSMEKKGLRVAGLILQVVSEIFVLCEALTFLCLIFQSIESFHIN